jgi:ADP-ribose pyrophosphatase YjhB (NUDIX family)
MIFQWTIGGYRTVRIGSGGMKIRRRPHRIVLIVGEEIHEAAVREVQEETGILTRFKSIIAFRHTTS